MCLIITLFKRTLCKDKNRAKEKKYIILIHDSIIVHYHETCGLEIISLKPHRGHRMFLVDFDKVSLR